MTFCLRIHIQIYLQSLLWKMKQLKTGSNGDAVKSFMASQLMDFHILSALFPFVNNKVFLPHWTHFAQAAVQRSNISTREKNTVLRHGTRLTRGDIFWFSLRFPCFLEADVRSGFQAWSFVGFGVILWAALSDHGGGFTWGLFDAPSLH